MPPRRSYPHQSQPSESFSLPYLGPPPTNTSLPPASNLAASQAPQVLTSQSSPPVLNVPSSSMTAQPLSRFRASTSQHSTPTPSIRRLHSAESSYSLPPIPSLTKPLVQTPSSANRVRTSPLLHRDPARTWPPLYGPSSHGITNQLTAMPRMAGMDVIEVSDNDDIQTPFRKRRREETAARRQRRRRAEYRLREAAVVEAARAVERERAMQLTATNAGIVSAHVSTGIGTESRAGTGIAGESRRSSALGLRPNVGAPSTSMPTVGIQRNVPTLPASSGLVTGASASGEGSTQLMRELRELRETVLALHNMGMNAEAHQLVQVTLSRLSRRE